MATPVTVLAQAGKPGGYISCRDLKHADPERAWELACCLMTAFNLIHERHPDVEEPTDR